MRSLGNIALMMFLFVLLSCEVKIPDHVIPPKKMEEFLYDYHLVQSMTSIYSSDEYREKLCYTYVYRKHGIEKARFDSSMQWYNRYPKHLRRIYEGLEARVNGEVEKLELAKHLLEDGVSPDALTQKGDSVNLWTGFRLKRLSSTALNSTLDFSFKVPEDTSFVKNDSLSFSFAAFFIPSEHQPLKQSAYAAIRLDYADGKVFTDALHVDSCGMYALSAPRHGSKLKTMSGFVHYTDDDTTAQAGLLLSDIKLVKVHPPVKK